LADEGHGVNGETYRTSVACEAALNRIEKAGLFDLFFRFDPRRQILAPNSPGGYGTACLIALKPAA